MGGLPEFHNGQIIGACIVEASVARTSELVGFSRATISRIMTKFKQHRKTFSDRRNSGWTSNFPNRYRRALKRIVG